MKQFFGNKSRRVLALVITISFALHVVAILIFGTIKFVSAVLREETVFEAAPVEVTPQKEPEYNVNIQQRNQSTPPPKPQVLAVNNASDLDIPALDIDLNVESSAVYGRSGGGFGGALSAVREMSVDFKLTDFGYTGQTEGTLEGTLIDLKRDRSGKGSGANRTQAIREFTDGDWNVRDLTRKFYSAKNKLYSSYWMIAMGPASNAPKSFGVEGEIEPSGILALYEGTYRPSRSMEMRFCGSADDAIIIRLDDKIVFDGSRSNEYSKFDLNKNGRHRALAGMNTPTYFGDWIKLDASKSYDLKILLAEVPGGLFGCALFYQLKKDEDDQKFRLFSTKAFTAEEKKLLREIHPDVADGLN
jgi:hypothetical protein